MNPDLNDIRKLLITLLALSLIVLLCSCGTRKVQKSIVKEDTKTEQATTEKKDITSNKETNTVINDESNEIEVTPIDTSKALIINGKTFKNAKVKIIHKKINTTIAEKATVKDLSKYETKAITTVKKQEVKRNVERKSSNLWFLLWLLIPIGLYLLYRFVLKGNPYFNFFLKLF